MPQKQEKNLYFACFEVNENGREFPKKGRKDCGKMKNCLLLAISPFHTVFSKYLYCRHVKNKGLFGKGLKGNILDVYMQSNLQTGSIYTSFNF